MLTSQIPYLTAPSGDLAFENLQRRNPVYHRNVVQPPSFNLERLPELIENTHKRLARAQIECAPYGEVLKRFDRTTTLFYLDPPYWGRSLYRHNFTEADFAELADRLKKVRGK